MEKDCTYPGKAFLRAVEHQAPGSKGAHGKSRGGHANKGGNPAIVGLSTLLGAILGDSVFSASRGDSFVSLLAATFFSIHPRQNYSKKRAFFGKIEEDRHANTLAVVESH